MGLKSVDASYNYIDIVENLKLPNLESLNLHSNGLRKFPIFEYALKLKFLTLSSNKLTDLDDMNPEFSPGLKQLNLSNN